MSMEENPNGFSLYDVSIYTCLVKGFLSLINLIHQAEYKKVLSAPSSLSHHHRPQLSRLPPMGTPPPPPPPPTPPLGGNVIPISR